MFSAILFDFNGVIIDDEPQHCEALIATLAEYGYPLDRETYYREYLGFDDRECFRYTFARGGDGVEPGRLAEAIERKNEHYFQAIGADMRLVPGAAEFVAGLRRHFGEIVSAEDVSACKPDPQGFNRAREALGLAAGRCVVVEDSLPGLAAARAAGLRCAMLTTSHAEDALTASDVVWRDFIGRSPRDLPWSHG